MRIALTAGGTFGHLFPAFSVYEAFSQLPGGPHEVRFFGPDERGERSAVEARGIRFVAVPAAQIRGRGPLQLARNLVKLAWGIGIAVRRLRAFHPAVVLSTGGYGSFPCCVAARILRRPLVVYLPDVSPGWAVRAEQRLATRMATTAQAALAFLPRAKTRVTGYPVRTSFFTQDRAAARAALGYAASDSVLVIAGASQGAQAINRAVWGALPALAGAGVHTVHLTGAADLAEAESQKATLGPNARLYTPAAFRDDLPTLMVAADLGVMRAGASVLGEVPAAALPAVFVPGTFAGAHQRDNARWLTDAGAGLVLEEADLAQFEETVLALLRDDARLGRMRAAAAALAQPNAAFSIATLLVEVAKT